MANIQVLDQHTIDKIAAGEVVERPASVVKELVENAIDAGSRAITIEIKDGGIRFIRITDNGVGIDKNQVKVAFLRHATSKIKSVEDLIDVSSLGFRGEALSSIAAVSQVELVSKTANALTGIRYCIHGGKEVSYEEIGCPEGTTFIVRNLFYNTPARRNFLKSAVVEASHIDGLLQRLALSHPNVSFKFISNNQNKLYTSGNGNMKDIIYHVYGREVASNLLVLDAKTEHISITGFIGKPYVSRGNRTYENYFVNGRYVRSGIINQAIEEGYKTYTMVHKYPFAALNFQINSELLDVNVHPTKMELRFRNGEELYRFIVVTIRDVLMEKELIPDVGIQKKEKAERPKAISGAPEPFERIRRDTQSNPTFVGYQEYKKTDVEDVVRETSIYGLENKSPLGEGMNERKPIKSDPLFMAAKQFVQTPSLIPNVQSARTDSPVELSMENNRLKEGLIALESKNLENDESQVENRTQVEGKTLIDDKSFERHKSQSMDETSIEQLDLFEEKLLSQSSRPSHKVIGQLFDTYWLIEFEQKLFVMDQHAAHEKVLYERLIQSLKEKEIYEQQIDPPVIVTLNAKERITLDKYKDYFTGLGFTVEAFGGNEFCIRSVPANLYGLGEKDLFIELMDSISEDVGITGPDLITDKIASMACKAAVKGNQKLSAKEVYGLIDELLMLDNPYTCPHGRPVIVVMTQTDIEKKFKRIQS